MAQWLSSPAETLSVLLLCCFNSQFHSQSVFNQPVYFYYWFCLLFLPFVTPPLTHTQVFSSFHRTVLKQTSPTLSGRPARSETCLLQPLPLPVDGTWPTGKISDFHTEEFRVSAPSIQKISFF